MNLLFHSILKTSGYFKKVKLEIYINVFTGHMSFVKVKGSICKQAKVLNYLSIKLYLSKVNFHCSCTADQRL